MNSNPPCHASSTLRLVLVEDSIPVRRRLAALLGAIDGVEIAGEAEEPAVALAWVDAGLADMVVLDLRLTAASGLDVLRSITRSGQPVIAMVLTNHSSPLFREACLSAGAHYFFDKTGEFDLARDTIARLARERHVPALAHTGADHV